MKKSILICIFLIYNLPLMYAQSVSETVKSNNYFAFDFYQQVAKIDQANIICSPLSISNTLAISYAAAKGNTAQEIAKVCYFEASGKNLHANFQEINEKISKQQGQHLTLQMANKCWFTANFTPKDSFMNLCRKYYKGSLEAIDFENFVVARNTMNNWVSNQTEQKINNLLPEGVITPLTRLVLMNAVYFKGDWEHTFNVKDTQDGEFFSEKGDTLVVPYMTQKNTFRYAKKEEVEILELPYKGEKYAMLLFLPNKESSFKEFETVFTAKNYYKWLSSLQEQKVTVTIPKFTLNPEKGYSLKSVLKNMGISTAFEGNADFSAAFDVETPVSIANIFHKGFIAVDETGTEAAASTSVIFYGRSISEEAHFNANRAFIYLIKDRENGNIVFMGRFINPNK